MLKYTYTFKKVRKSRKKKLSFKKLYIKYKHWNWCQTNSKFTINFIREAHITMNVINARVKNIIYEFLKYYFIFCFTTNISIRKISVVKLL